MYVYRYVHIRTYLYISAYRNTDVFEYACTPICKYPKIVQYVNMSKYFLISKWHPLCWQGIRANICKYAPIYICICENIWIFLCLFGEKA